MGCAVVFEQHPDYLVFEEPEETWPDARNVCLDEGRDLVSIHSDEENLALREQSVLNPGAGEQFGDGEHLWIGAQRTDGTGVRYNGI